LFELLKYLSSTAEISLMMLLLLSI